MTPLSEIIRNMIIDNIKNIKIHSHSSNSMIWFKLQVLVIWFDIQFKIQYQCQESKRIKSKKSKDTVVTQHNQFQSSRIQYIIIIVNCQSLSLSYWVRVRVIVIESLSSTDQLTIISLSLRHESESCQWQWVHQWSGSLNDCQCQLSTKHRNQICSASLEPTSKELQKRTSATSMGRNVGSHLFLALHWYSSSSVQKNKTKYSTVRLWQ